MLPVFLFYFRSTKKYTAIEKELDFGNLSTTIAKDQSLTINTANSFSGSASKHTLNGNSSAGKVFIKSSASKALSLSVAIKNANEDSKLSLKVMADFFSIDFSLVEKETSDD